MRKARALGRDYVRAAPHLRPVSGLLQSAWIGRSTVNAYAKAAQRARAAIHADPIPGIELLKHLCEEALALAPDDQKETWRAYLRALQPGHTIKTKTYPMTVVAIGGIDAELVHAVDEIFQEEG
jgi:hypothetical protein